MLNGSLKPYLTYSALGHGLLLAGLALFVKNGLRQPDKVYRIDFIGATGGILGREREPAPSLEAAGTSGAASRPPPLSDPDDFSVRPFRRPKPLPRPSFLAPGEKEKPGPGAGEDKSPAAAASSPLSGAGGGEPGISASATDFPYPWYLSQLRASLWDRWSGRMPGTAGECTVSFSILRNGALTDLKVEDPSGDDAYDYTALSAVQEASPLPPLPREYGEPFLKVHVRFRSR